MAKIKGGYYIKARQISNSTVVVMPPYVREIWDYLLREANHKDNSVCKRGELIRTYADIIDALKWYVGYRLEVYKKWQIEKALIALTKADMIATRKLLRGLHITIKNYAYFQNPKNYESYTDSGTKADTRGDTNKQECKKEEIVYSENTLKIADLLGIEPTKGMDEYVCTTYKNFLLKDQTLLCRQWCEDHKKPVTTSRWMRWIRTAHKSGELERRD